MGVSDRTIRWIENLADQEARIGSGERRSIDLCNTKDELIEVETAAFLREVRRQLEYLVELFNSKVILPALRLKIEVAELQCHSFSISRAEMKLSIWSPQPGWVRVQCDKIIKDPASSAYRPSVMMSGAIEANFGAFNDVDWMFLSSVVTPEQVARHYLTEFIQISRSH